jgi:hypothetical protein
LYTTPNNKRHTTHHCALPSCQSTRLLRTTKVLSALALGHDA